MSADNPFPDRIAVRGIRLEGRHGANEGERDHAQPFEVDVVLHASLRDAAARDELEATVDYRRLAEIAAEVVEGPSVTLIETIALRIGEAVLVESDAALVDAVDVSVRKPQAAMPAAVDAVEVTLTVRRGDAGP